MSDTASGNKAQSGLTSLIPLIIMALIFMFFSGGRDTEKLRNQIDGLNHKVDRLEKKIDELSSPQTDSKLADGAAIYKTECTPCHGADGGGQTPFGKNLKVRDLRSEEVRKLSDADITKVLTDGKGKMPKSKLAADDIKAVIAFMRSLKN